MTSNNHYDEEKNKLEQALIRIDEKLDKLSNIYYSRDGSPKKYREEIEAKIIVLEKEHEKISKEYRQCLKKKWNI